jgi:antirestriction protein ArdC
MANNLHADVTARILQSLEAGIAPWVKPWSATPGRNVPLNVISGKAYQGVNAILLWGNSGRFATPHYLTYKQALDLGGHVRKGETGFAICKVLQLVSKPKDGAADQDGRAFSTMKFFTVFNVDQCEGLPSRVFDTPEYKPNHSDARDATIDEFIAATGANYSETGGDRAFYNHGSDSVRMPTFDSFKSAAVYYSTAFHELGHWTGHASRCAREFGKRFGDKQYAAEELVAELTSAFLCAEFSIDGALQHADYIGNWISLLKEDAKAFFTAASAAQKAADYLRRAALAEALPLAA